MAEGSSLSQFLVSLIINGVVLIAMLSVFFIVNNKKKFFPVFSTRKAAYRRLRPPPPADQNLVGPPPSNIVSWIKKVVSFHISDMKSLVNLDSYFFLRYIRMIAMAFAVSTLVYMPILIAVNATGGGTSTGMDIMSFGNVSNANASKRYWAPLIVSVFFICMMIFGLYYEYKNYVIERSVALTSAEGYGSSLMAATIMLRDVPMKELESPENFLTSIPGSSAVHIAKDVAELTKLVNDRNTWANKLEGGEAKLASIARKLHAKKVKKGKAEPVDDHVQTENETSEATLVHSKSSGALLRDNSYYFNELKESDKNANVEGRSSQTLNPSSSSISLNNLAKPERGLKKSISTNTLASDSEEIGDKGVEVTDYDIVPEKKRPTVRMPVNIFGKEMNLPLMGKKVDLIARARSEIARLNSEIESIQNDKEKIKNISTVFIEFQSQHAAQSYAHDNSKMKIGIKAKPVTDVDPRDIIWKNLSLSSHQRFIRKIGANSIIFLMTIFWTVITAFIGCVSNVTYLADNISWLSWLNSIPSAIMGIITAYLPAIILAVVISLVPLFMRMAAKLRGCATNLEIELVVQKQFFFFLFLQEFLVLVISNSATVVVNQIIDDPSSAPTLLAESIPKASNFYFSYILLKGICFPGGALLQIGAIAMVGFVGKYLDSTPRAVWKRQNGIPGVSYATSYSTFVNLACIGLIYSMVAPFIICLVFVAFVFFYYVYKYMLLQVYENRIDYLGVNFPIAIRQTFVGLYFLEIMLCGLFFLASDDSGSRACIPQGVIMAVMLGLTAIANIYINYKFKKYDILLPLDVANPNKTITEQEQEQLPISGLEDRSLIFKPVDYNAPVLFEKRPVLWVAKDTMNVYKSEVGDALVSRSLVENDQSLAEAKKDFYVVDQGAYVDAKGEFSIHAAPPRQVDVWS